LAVPQPIPQDYVSTLIPTSPWPKDSSFAPSDVEEEGPERYVCECGATYVGLYGKSNFQRHRRLKHRQGQGPPERQYDCEEHGCPKSYKRQDARIKHYRTYHPHLAGPALSRKP
jgi:uncharacterized Zn-finger protein